MSSRIEDYALIGDCHTAALVGRDGSIDWLCFPRFDSPACFAALLGSSEHGRWLLAPAGLVRKVRRRYREGTLVLETDYETDSGEVTIIDLMPPRRRELGVVRTLVGKRGHVPMRMELVLRSDYGSIVPWVRQVDRGIRAIAGPDGFLLQSDVEVRGDNLATVAEFVISEGERAAFVLMWFPSHEPPPQAFNPVHATELTDRWWRRWSSRSTYEGPWHEAVLRSLITLKALTYAPTGGIVAAPTTSLPERLGGVRNWDYRYAWLRDSTFTLYALLMGGYESEARAWREWLVRAVAGTPGQLRIMYGVAGERRLTELTLDWLPGYENSAPVRIGNAAFEQLQLDVFGEVIDTLNVVRRVGLGLDDEAWHVQRALLDFLESAWDQPDHGIWEVRGPKRHFTHSKVMAWVAVDRMVKTVERLGLDGPVDRWRGLRARIHDEVCTQGYDGQQNSFVQYYGGTELDASLLRIPLVGFLPADDPRVVGTLQAIERNLLRDGFVARYTTDRGVDGLSDGEGAFLPCTFWLADNYALLGRADDARRTFERTLAVGNDVGLMSEEYDPKAQRLLGNFPQAFTHVGLVNTACNLAGRFGPAEHRQQA